MKTTLILISLFSFDLLASDALISLGERLFNDGRFSRHFWQNAQGQVNATLKNGESHLDVLVTPLGPVASPFSGESTSCASCHMVDQAFSNVGMRTYTDFAPTAPIPTRMDLQTHTARNTPGLVGIGSAFNRNRFSHWDGEFSDHAETVLGNFTGRNMGWLKTESSIALKNIVKVLREDNGQAHQGAEFGGSYESVFRSGQDVEEEFRLDSSERVDFKKASDQEVITAVITAVTAYLDDLDFQKNEKGEYVGSPFDLFLLKNGFTTVPKKGETSKDFTERLRNFLQKLTTPKFIAEVEFPTHNKKFGFGHRELQGAKIFFNLPNHPGNKGSCFKCHAAPLFSDQSFHNIGTSQAIYDEVHGFGAFIQKYIPKEEYRADLYLNQAADNSDPSKMDLGLWNFYNRNIEVTEFFKKEICLGGPCDLEMTIGRFKTASLRDLAHSNPYFHHGQMADLTGVLAHYMKVGIQARQGLMRNPDPILKEIQLNGHGLQYLQKFLDSLNEDYE